MGRILHCGAALALLLLLVAAVYIVVYDPLVTEYRVNSQRIDQRARQIAATQGVIDSGPAVQARVERLRADTSFATLYLPDASDVLAANRLQQQVKEIVEAAGGTLLSSQKLPTRAESPFEAVAVRVNISGDTEAVASVLHSIESQAEPLLILDELQLQSRNRRQTRRVDNKRVVESITDVTATFDITGYRREVP
ncbi:MAG: type II secretion system protein M [Chromatiales bacterium]|nr:type II secretion system protein M [Chromatiales bacterium]